MVSIYQYGVQYRPYHTTEMYWNHKQDSFDCSVAKCHQNGWCENPKSELHHKVAKAHCPPIISRR
jgi:hypothetical protein